MQEDAHPPELAHAVNIAKTIPLATGQNFAANHCTKLSSLMYFLLKKALLPIIGLIHCSSFMSTKWVMTGEARMQGRTMIFTIHRPYSRARIMQACHSFKRKARLPAQ